MMPTRPPNLTVEARLGRDATEGAAGEVRQGCRRRPQRFP